MLFQGCVEINEEMWKGKIDLKNFEIWIEEGKWKLKWKKKVILFNHIELVGYTTKEIWLTILIGKIYIIMIYIIKSITFSFQYNF